MLPQLKCLWSVSESVMVKVHLCERRQLVPLLWGHPGSNTCRGYSGRCAVSLPWICLWGAQMLTQSKCLWSVSESAMVKVRLCERRQLTPLVSGHPGVISAVSIRVGTQFRYYGLVSGVLKCVHR